MRRRQAEKDRKTKRATGEETGSMRDKERGRKRESVRDRKTDRVRETNNLLSTRPDNTVVTPYIYISSTDVKCEHLQKEIKSLQALRRFLTSGK